MQVLTPDGPIKFRYARFGETFTYANFVAFRSIGPSVLDRSDARVTA